MQDMHASESFRRNSVCGSLVGVVEKSSKTMRYTFGLSNSFAPTTLQNCHLTEFRGGDPDYLMQVLLQ